MRKLFLLALLMGVTSQAMSQRQLTVLDVETLEPIGGVNVSSKEGTFTTDSLGHICISDSCKTLIFSHVNYESRIINVNEVHDKVYLISKLLYLNEVVVFGNGKSSDISEDVKNQFKLEKTEAQLLSIDPKSVDILPFLTRLIPKKWRKNSKSERRKRLKEILDDY